MTEFIVRIVMTVFCLGLVVVIHEWGHLIMVASTWRACRALYRGVRAGNYGVDVVQKPNSLRHLCDAFGRYG